MNVERMKRKQLENAVNWWRNFGLDVWMQWASYQDVKGKTRYSNMCLSTLEEVEDALQRLGMIDKKGRPVIKKSKKEIKS